jgi:hypothetical protein
LCRAGIFSVLVSGSIQIMKAARDNEPIAHGSGEQILSESLEFLNGVRAGDESETIQKDVSSA